MDYGLTLGVGEPGFVINYHGYSISRTKLYEALALGIYVQ